MKKNMEIVCILDRSGSMSGLESDTIGGYNAFIERERKECENSYVTTVLFDDKYDILVDRKKITEVPKLTEKEYTVRGCTALVDAVGKTIRHIVKIHQYVRPEDVPDHTVFMITTDGKENASHLYSAEEVKRMVKKMTEKFGWEFLFFGANIDAIQTAKHYGFREENAVNYHNDGEGIAVLYESAGCAMDEIRNKGSLKNNRAWREKADRDFKSR